MITDIQREAIVRQFALGLQKQDLELITDIIDPELRFLYRIGYNGHGITTDIRFIGHLYKTFHSMKKKGIGINMKFCYVIKSNVRYLAIMLLPPLDMSIVFPAFNQLSDLEKEYYSKQERIMMFTFRNDLICKIVCLNMQDFKSRIDGYILPYND